MPGLVLLRGGGCLAGKVFESLRDSVSAESMGVVVWDNADVVHNSLSCFIHVRSGIEILEYIRSCPYDSISVYVLVGCPSVRRCLVQEVRQTLDTSPIPYQFPNVIHKTASMSNSAKLGIGNIVCAFAIVDSSVVGGDFCYAGGASFVGHDVVFGSFVNISPHGVICGNVSLGDEVFIGANAVVRDHVVVSDKSIVGAGAVVVSNIQDQSSTWVGNPAKQLHA